MVKRVFIIHGWGGRPDAGWLAWLNKELSSKGFKVYSPIMPDSENPKIDAWVGFLKKAVGTPDENTYFVGHSIGCQTILRYAESLPENTKLGGAVFVAGWFNLKGLESDEERKMAKPWLSIPMNFSKIKLKINKIFALFSKDDPYVPINDSKLFSKRLGAEVLVEDNKGHYIENTTLTIPIVLNKLVSMAK